MSENTLPSNIYQGQQKLEELQRESDKLIVVDFVGPHCSACATLKPVLYQLAGEHSETIQLIEIDATKELELAREMDVYSTPTVILFKQNQVLTTLVGLQPKKRYVEAIAQFS